MNTASNDMRWLRFAAVFSCIAFALVSLAAENVFTGPGLWSDDTRWSSGAKPTSSATTAAKIHGLCAATNASEIIYGPNSAFYVGDNAASGRTMGFLDVKNCWMSFPKALYVGGDSEYCQEGGTNVMTGGVQLGSGAGYATAKMYMKNVDLVRLGAASTFGASIPADGGYAEYRQEGGALVSSTARTYGNKSRVTLKDVVWSVSSSDTLGGDSVFHAERSSLTNTSGSAVTTADCTLSFADCNVSVVKPYFGNSAGAFSKLYFTNTAYTCKYQTYLGYVASSTCRWEMVDSAWTNTDNEVVFGNGNGSCVEAVFKGKNVFKLKGSPRIASGANSCATVVFEDVDASDLVLPLFTFAYTPSTANGRLVLRNVSGAKGWSNIPTPAARTGGNVVMEFDNAHYSGAMSYIISSTAAQKLTYVLNNGATFVNTRNDKIYFPGNANQEIGICATNSTILFLYGTQIPGDKDNCDVTVSLYDSDASISTNSTWGFATKPTSSGRITVAGTSGKNMLDVKTLALGNGTNEIFLCGNAFRVLQITRSGGNGMQKLHFNGGTLRSRGTASAWIPAGLTSLVEEGGAVFDARHEVTIPAVLCHGGKAAKDGGLRKKGSGTLTLSSATAHTFTGDIIVEEGTLVATALSNWTLAAGQKIGGAGTLRVGSGFSAGGVVYDMSQGNGLTVDGDVEFEEGSSLEVTGLEDVERFSARTVLTATSITGSENFDRSSIPSKCVLRARGNSLVLAPRPGLFVIVR